MIFAFNMFREFPEMRKDFPTPEIIRGLLGNLGLTFFGGKNTPVRFHYDIDCSGVLMTLQGERWMEKKRATAFENARKEMIKGKFRRT